MSSKHIAERPCRLCGAVFLPIESQVRRNDWRCIHCRRQQTREYVARRKAEGRPITEGPARRERKKQFEAEYSRRPEVLASKARKMRERFKRPDERVRMDARSATRRAVAAGALDRLPCFVCGNLRSQAHHVAYDMPLAVAWLCDAHHRQVHAEHAAAGGAQQ